MEFKQLIRSIPDYPKPGIMFRDITTLLQDAQGFHRAVEELAQPYADQNIDKVAGLEARGFIFASAVAYRLSKGFVAVRKKGKLPWNTYSQQYQLEYADDELEIHQDMVMPGEKVLLIDDLIATGGTALAGIQLLERAGAQVIACSFVIGLPDLGGIDKVKKLGIPLTTLVNFEGD